MIRVHEINNPAELSQYRLHWNSLLPQTLGATFFQTFEWLETYWRHYGDQQRMRVLVVSVSGRPIGILPLAVRREQTSLGRVRILTYPLDGWGAFFGPIGPNRTATLLTGLKHIRSTPRDWDLVDLRWVDADGHDAGRAGNAMRAAGMAADAKPFVHSAQIQLDGDWNPYWSQRASHLRDNVVRDEQRLADFGEVEHIRYRPEGSRFDDGDPRWDLYEACESIAHACRQGSADDGTTLNHEAARNYLRAAHVTAAAAGGLDLNLLWVAGRPAAFAYNYHYRGSVYCLRTAVDPDATIDGSGTVLVRRMIEDSFARGDHLLDLGPGSLEAKRHWATNIQTSYRYPYYAPLRVKAQALRMKRWLAGAKG